MLPENHSLRAYPQTTRLLIACGAIGPSLFTVVYLIEGATRPGYDAWRQAASALSLSDQGWVQVINFIVCGLLILGFALGLRQTLRGGRGATWGPILIAAVGAGLVMAGVFVTDPALGYPPGTPPGPAVHTTLHGALHWVLGGLVVFSCLPASCFVFARRWVSDAEWRGWALYSVASGVMMIAFFVAFAVASMNNGPAGLFERISLSFGMLWMTLFAIRLLLLMRSPAPSPATSR
jgi:hypothetical protein